MAEESDDLMLDELLLDTLSGWDLLDGGKCQVGIMSGGISVPDSWFAQLIEVATAPRLISQNSLNCQK